MLFIYATQLNLLMESFDGSNSSIIRLVASSMNQSSLVAGNITVQNISRPGTASLYEGLGLHIDIYPFLLTCSECGITISQCTDPGEMDLLSSGTFLS